MSWTFEVTKIIFSSGQFMTILRSPEVIKGQISQLFDFTSNNPHISREL